MRCQNVLPQRLVLAGHSRNFPAARDVTALDPGANLKGAGYSRQKHSFVLPVSLLLHLRWQRDPPAQKLRELLRPLQASFEAMLARAMLTQAEAGEHVLAPACLLLLLL